MHKVIALVCVLSVVGCSTELTPEAQLVRQIPAQTVTQCTFLGPVSGSEAMGIDVAADAESAFNKMRNKVAERGGNAFVLNHSASTYDSSNVQADAYKCP